MHLEECRGDPQDDIHKISLSCQIDHSQLTAESLQLDPWHKWKTLHFLG